MSDFGATIMYEAKSEGQDDFIYDSVGVFSFLHFKHPQRVKDFHSSSLLLQLSPFGSIIFKFITEECLEL